MADKKVRKSRNFYIRRQRVRWHFCTPRVRGLHGGVL